MSHSSFTRPGTGRHAVLLLHGIAGSPNHFRDLVPAIPEEFAVYGILLDGHSGTVREFSRSSMEKWKEQVRSTVNKLLERHDKLVIVGHSMGALFAIQAAIRHPNRIPRLFLLAVPTRVWLPPSTMLTCLQVAFGKTDNPRAAAMGGDTGIALTPKLWEYLGWVPRMLELLAECRQVRKQLPQLTVPTLVFQSQKDELVSLRSCQDLERSPCITNILLPDSGHFVYGPADTRLLQTRLREILAGDLTTDANNI